MDGEASAVPAKRLQEIQQWADTLKNASSGERLVEAACRGLLTCGSQQVQHTRDGTAAADAGAIEGVFTSLLRAESLQVVGYLWWTLFNIMASNSRVSGIVEEHSANFVPLLKEHSDTLKHHQFALSKLCLVLTQVSRMRCAGPQLCSVIPTMTEMMQKEGATDRDFQLATCVIANFARSAVMLQDKRFWKSLDSYLDVAFLTDLVVSNVSERRKGEAETVLLMMYADQEDHPSTRVLLKHDAVRNFVLPYLEHSYARTNWHERGYYFNPDQFFLVRYVSNGYLFAKQLKDLGIVELCARMVMQQETADDANILELIWGGKTSALVGLTNIAAHTDLRDAVAAAASSIPFQELALHSAPGLRQAAARLALELQLDPE